MNEGISGQNMYDFCKELFPICRSITGEGVRATLNAINERISVIEGVSLEIKSIASGTPVFDWTVPKEWLIRNAYIEDESGNHLIDFKENNLHVLGYATPVDKWVDLDELKSFIYTQADQPDVIPYVTSYYKERFGFCMSENQKNSLGPGKYHMVIDSLLFDGVLNYAEVVIPGDCEEEVFFSTYICHPSMANNECSGPVLATELIKYVAQMRERDKTYHFVFIPETIGSISFLSQNGNLEYLKEHMIAGFNLSCVGDNNGYSMIESKSGNTLADRVLRSVLKNYTHSNDSIVDNSRRGINRYSGYTVYSFLHRGSDERQYNAPGVDLPVVCFCRSKFGEYPEYHTSADDMNFVSAEGFKGSYDVMTQVIDAIEYNRCYQVSVLCEPQLGKRNLYPTISQKGSYNEVYSMKNMIAYSDGQHDLIDISEITGTPISELIPIVKDLVERELLL